MRLFTTIELTCREISDVVYPCVNLIDLQSVASEYLTGDGNTYFLLEKVEIDRSNAEQMAALANAVFYQSVLYYMGSSVYMSSYVWMGGYDLGVDPSYIDITDVFTNGLPYIVDTETDLTRYMYLYRILTRYRDGEYASLYVAGIQHIEFENDSSVDLSDDQLDILPPGTARGDSALYAESDAGIITIKGFPVPVFNPRYRGPLDGHKERARRDSFARALNVLNDMLGDVEDSLDYYRRYLGDVTDDIVGTVKG